MSEYFTCEESLSSSSYSGSESRDFFKMLRLAVPGGDSDEASCLAHRPFHKSTVHCLVHALHNNGIDDEIRTTIRNETALRFRAIAFADASKSEVPESGKMNSL